jgi:hypothetical protein
MASASELKTKRNNAFMFSGGKIVMLLLLIQAIGRLDIKGASQDLDLVYAIPGIIILLNLANMYIYQGKYKKALQSV